MFEDSHIPRLVMSQPVAELTVYVFVCAVLEDAINGAFYTDTTMVFPLVSLEGMEMYYIA